MSSDIETMALEELCEQVIDCPHSTPVWMDSGVIVLRSSNIRNGRLDLSSPSYTDEYHYEERSRRAKLQAGDLVITREAPMGEVCLIPENLRCCLGQRMVMLRPDQERCQGKYLLYALQSNRVQNEIRSHEGTGSTVSNLRIPVLKSLPIPTPDLASQKAIAHILGTLDDKIELNRKTNEALEAMARTLFQSWFVDFDPVRAKAEGRPTGLPDEISDLFPDSFEDSELGEIPIGWTTGCIRDLIVKAGMGPFGSRMKTDTFQKQGVPIIKGGNLKGMYVEGYGPDFLSHEHAVGLESSCVRAGDIVLTHRGTLGQASMVPFGGQVEKYVVSQSQFYLRPVSVSAGFYLLFFLHSSVGVSKLLANASGVGVPSLARPSTLTPQIGLPIPSSSLLDCFASQAIGVQQSFMARLEEQSSLCSIRDTLLPKLISGELRIPEAERLLEEAGV